MATIFSSSCCMGDGPPSVAGVPSSVRSPWCVRCAFAAIAPVFCLVSMPRARFSMASAAFSSCRVGTAPLAGSGVPVDGDSFTFFPLEVKNLTIAAARVREVGARPSDTPLERALESRDVGSPCCFVDTQKNQKARGVCKKEFLLLFS